MRGKLVEMADSEHALGITPAPAGKTLKNDVDTL